MCTLNTLFSKIMDNNLQISNLMVEARTRTLQDTFTSVNLGEVKTNCISLSKAVAKQKRVLRSHLQSSIVRENRKQIHVTQKSINPFVVVTNPMHRKNRGCLVTKEIIEDIYRYGYVYPFDKTLNTPGILLFPEISGNEYSIPYNSPYAEVSHVQNTQITPIFMVYNVFSLKNVQIPVSDEAQCLLREISAVEDTQNLLLNDYATIIGVYPTKEDAVDAILEKIEQEYHKIDDLFHEVNMEAKYISSLSKTELRSLGNLYRKGFGWKELRIAIKIILNRQEPLFSPSTGSTESTESTANVVGYVGGLHKDIYKIVAM